MREIERNRERQAANQNNAGAGQAEDRTCVVCLERPKRVAYNCGHLCTCERCNQALLNLAGNRAQCPMCRTQIDRW
jgi:hypothetical protein